MRLYTLLVVLLINCMLCTAADAQLIYGEVADMETKGVVNEVTISNIYNDISITTGIDGKFTIAARSDELLEFKKTGYKTVRVRIPKGYIPSYFKIIMQPGFARPDELLAEQSNRYNYRQDSLRYAELYKHELDFPKLSGFHVIESPFSALSRKNREIWQFQEDYDDFEKQKYVDKTFNGALVSRFTGLTGDSLQRFMVRYRPSYEQLRSMNDYSFFMYIKQSVEYYRRANTPRFGQ